MKIVILAGGQQSTITEHNEFLPKPMAEIGEKPILWHIMKNFSSYGFSEFIICGGYKVNMIKEYFMDYYVYQSDITVDLQTNVIELHKKKTEAWKVSVVDTGLHTSPSQRIVQIEDYVKEDDFIVVHGDCLSDIDFTALVKQHEDCQKIATVAVARPTGRNEMLPISSKGELMTDFVATLPENQAWANACCHIFKKEIFKYLQKFGTIDIQLLDCLASERNLNVYRHEGFWTPVETKRDHVLLENLWYNKKAPWKKW